MFAVTTSDVQRFSVSALGGLLLAAACVVGGAGQARAAGANAPLTVGDWQAEVEQQIDRSLRVPAGALASRDHAVATVRIAFDAQGGFAGASVAQSSGLRPVDAEALRVARALSYPALPEGLRGRPQTIAMQLYFGQARGSAEQARHQDRAEALAERAKGGPDAERNIQVAALPSG